MPSLNDALSGKCAVDRITSDASDCYLRELTPVDASISCHWRNDPDVWRFTQHRPDRVITEQIEREWILRVLGEKSSIRMAICLKETNQYIGNVQVTNITPHTGHFHIFIGDKALWGSGYAYEGAMLMLEHISRKTAIPLLECWIHKENDRSLRLHKRLGFSIASQDSGGHFLLKKIISRGT